MDTKEYFKSLVEIVAFKAKKTQEQLAVEMGYGKTYISEVLSPTGKLSTKFLEAFKVKYKQYLEGATIMMPLPLTSSTQMDEHTKYVRLLEDQVAFLKQQVQASLGEISDNIIAGRAENRAALEYQVMKDSKGDQKRVEILKEQINTLIHLQLTGGEKESSSSVSGKKGKT